MPSFVGMKTTCAECGQVIHDHGCWECSLCDDCCDCPPQDDSAEDAYRDTLEGR